MTATDTRPPVDVPAGLLPSLQFPDLGTLPDERGRGAACLWGGEPLSIATALDLGEHPHEGTTLFLRGCRVCTLRAALAAHKAHPGMCEQCTDDPSICEIRRGLRRLALELRR
ncbi:hypothetical protein JK361_28625 [Streptomyces sp. 5-8]|uniref:Uncharacterized protein n=1 Tax=Streptomyces musisoli TaxID=2802280 RepID=A0ABS1P8W6_9ACTN|nr:MULTISPECIES: hypothetical protein [Streptomyces]MBL1108505.1 hypothetical protein [Streptomyces musisoli]MBY8841236.1 hypothetical protein [Streptomyces sp. SP2-10]